MNGPVVVTGGAGFVGSHVVEQLLVAGEEVVSIDCLHPGAHAVEPDPPAGATHHRVDLRDLDAVSEAVAGARAVSHQAAMVGLGVDLDDLTDYVSHNDLATATMLRALHRTGFRGRLVLAGSMVVYGEGCYRCPNHGTVAAPPRNRDDLAAGRFEPGCPHCGADLVAEAVTEDAAADPRSVYAATKLAQEHLCRVYAREAGVELTVLRYHNVYGPRMPRDTPYAGVASIFRSACEGGQPPQVFEDGAQRRDFVHVSDVARANLLALRSVDAAPGTYNIASGQVHTILDLAETLTNVAGPDAPRPQVTGDFRLGDVRHVFASTARAREGLGFTAEVGFDKGVAEFASAPLRPRGSGDDAPRSDSRR